jgi:transcriptional regulator with XRE-family HTH domain
MWTKQTNRPPGENAVPTRPGPTVQRRRLGIELRRLREQAGKTIDEVARVLECSDSKVSRIENGQVSASPRDVRDMLKFYGVEDERREELVEFARTARKKGWWEAYGDTLAVPLVGLEVAAHRILAYEAMVVYGLLQTEDYARAQIRAHAPEISEERVQRRVEFRMARQNLLMQEMPPTLEVILEECALRRPVGGRRVMRTQLKRLAEVAALPGVTLQVLPLGVGEHAAMTGAFTVYRFAEPSDPDVVLLEHAASDLYVENPDQIERYSSAFDRLRAAAMNPHQSASFLEALAEEMI